MASNTQLKKAVKACYSPSKTFNTVLACIERKHSLDTSHKIDVVAKELVRLTRKHKRGQRWSKW